MGKPEKVTNRNAVEKAGESRSGTVAASEHPDSISSVPALPKVPKWSQEAHDALCFFNARDDGWLRITGQEFGTITYYKWKFSAGKHKGKYVMYRDDDCDPFVSLVGLARKVEEVYMGLRKPAQDTFYDPRD